MARINLLHETVNLLVEVGRKAEDVEFVTDGKRWCRWDEFSASANRITYNNGYGGAEINEGLKVVGKDWWLERGEYDGSEWWEYKTLPTKPELQDRVDILGEDR